MIAFERLVDAFRAEGLNVKDMGHGRASAQAPGHSPQDLSVSIKDIGDQVLVHSHSDPTEDVLAALNLTMADLFDSPKGATYNYPDGRVVRRSVDKKFFQSNAENKTSLYRADRIVDADEVYLCEGEKDVHALEAEGVAACCTAMGAGKAHLFDLTPLHGKHVIVVRDMDAPGEAHARQVLDLLSAHAEVTVVEPKSGKDAADHVAAGFGVDQFVPASGFESHRLVAALRSVIDSAGDMAFDDAVAAAYAKLDALSAQKAPTKLRRFDELVNQWWDWIDTPREKVRTIGTPWPELDDALAGGLQPGRSYLIAGRPGAGKSLGLTNVAAYAAEKGHKGALWSVEMGSMELVSRIMAAGAKAEYGQITRRQMDDFNRGRVTAYASDSQGMPLWISDEPSVTVEQIRSQARALKSQHGLDFVAVDYAQLLKASDSKATRERQIANISWGLKTMSRELDVAVVTACQLNRGAAKDNRAPTIAELRESGSLEQDADVVILLHHEQREGVGTGEVQMILGKNRTGPLSTLTMPWRGSQARIG